MFRQRPSQQMSLVLTSTQLGVAFALFHAHESWGGLFLGLRYGKPLVNRLGIDAMQEHIPHHVEQDPPLEGVALLTGLQPDRVGIHLCDVLHALHLFVERERTASQP